jgi:hypothetical protein
MAPKFPIGLFSFWVFSNYFQLIICQRYFTRFRMIFRIDAELLISFANRFTRVAACSPGNISVTKYLNRAGGHAGAPRSPEG